ncbi:MAG: hypothetical protein ACE361_20055 [Aureliella sp.]
MKTTTPSSPFEPVRDTGNDAEEQQRTSAPVIILASLAAMLPWPLMAIGFCSSAGLLEEASDSALMFGGITLIFLLPLGFFDPPEWTFAAIFSGVWGLVLVLPALLAASERLRKRHLVFVYVIQAGFSIAQAGLGLLMIVGRSV